MSFELDAIVGSDTVSLSDGAPFALMSARGMAGPPIRRVTARGPSQHGDTDLGYRLQPREIELELGFHASTDAILDGYRDTLTNLFKPLTATPINLRVTRDNGDIVRQIDVYTIGQIKISLLPEQRAAHYHRAVIRLRAHDPVWYDPVPGTVTVDEPLDLASDWYLAGGAIGTARVLMHGTLPAQGEAWSYTGTVLPTESFTVAWRGEMPAAPAGDNKYAFYADAGTVAAYFAQTGIQSDSLVFLGATIRYVGTLSGLGTTNFFFQSDPVQMEPGQFSELALVYYDTADDTIKTRYPDAPVIEAAISGTVRYWRRAASSYTNWDKDIPLYALYSPRLDNSEIAALDTYMVDIGGTDLYRNANVQLQGDMPDYPTISITGPITNPQIYHTYTGERLVFLGTVGAGTTRVIDLRHGYKTVLEGTVNKRSELTSYSDLDTWHLSADFAQGVNVFALTGENVGTATAIEIVYHHRYSSY